MDEETKIEAPEVAEVETENTPDVASESNEVVE